MLQSFAPWKSATNDSFGWSVTISGNRIVVGAPTDDIGSNFNQGSAYVFVRSGVTWIQQQKLTANDGAAEDLFGRSVAISGYEVIVGALNDDIGAETNQGSAYVFASGGGATWSLQQKLTASNGYVGHKFGYSVAVSVGTFVVGAPQWDFWGFILGHGAAYVFVRQ